MESGGWGGVGLPLSLGVYSVVREGAGAAAGCQLTREFIRGSFSTYMVVVSEAGMCWQHVGAPAVTVASPATLKGAP